jgi:hypothetical protein
MTAQERGRMAYCSANLRSIGQALQLYADEHEDRLPAAAKNNSVDIWDTAILPYMGETEEAFRCPNDRVEDPNPPDPDAVRRTYSANASYQAPTAPQRYPLGVINPSAYLEQPATLSDLNYNLNDIILISERPCERNENGVYTFDAAGSRGHVGYFGFCTLDQHAGNLHQNRRGCNYLMGSFAVQYMTTNMLLTTTTNYWTIHTQ